MIKVVIKNSVLLVLLASFSCAYGQENKQINPSFKSVKIHSNSTLDFSDPNKHFVSMLRTFSPSIAWGREYGNFNELLLNDFGLNITNGQTRFSSSIDYSYNVKIGKFNPSSNWNFYVGAGARLGTNFTRNLPQVSTDFSSVNFSSSMSLVLTPRVSYNLGKRVSLEMSLPYSVYDYNRNIYRHDNPVVPVNERRNVANSATTFPNQFTVRVGVAIKF